MTDARRLGMAIALLTLISVGLWVHPYRAQQASRYALTAAISERGTIALDGYEDVIGIDRSVRDGTVYSDKAPGQPFMAVPFYLAYRALGGQPATTLQIDGNLGLWWQTFWFASVPLAVLAYLMYRDAIRISNGAFGGVILLVFGTLLFPFGALLFGHVLSALFVYGAWFLLRRSDESTPAWLALSGALIGLAVITEYTAALAGGVVLAYAAVRHRARSVWIVVGGVPFAGLLGWYNAVAFGDPFTLSYSFSAFDEVTDVARPVTSLFGSFRPEHLGDLFLSPRGFLVASPIVILALVVSLMMVIRREKPIEGVVPIVVFVLYLMIPLFWGNPWGGDSPGPRYMIPALPFLAVPAAVAWQRFKIPTGLAGGLGVITMVAATITDPMLARDGDWGLNVWGRWVVAGDFVPSLPWVLWGGTGSFVTLALIVVGIAYLARQRVLAHDG